MRQLTRSEKDQILNEAGYKCLLLIGMIYMSIMLCNAILTNRLVGTNQLFVLGGTLTSPFFFIIGDIVGEVYGYKIAKFMVIAGFAAQTLFVIICQAVIAAPAPDMFHHNQDYARILGMSLVRIDVSGFIAYVIASIVNVNILTRWKAMVKGRYFWLRSIGSSSFSEILYSFIAIMMMELNNIPLYSMLKVITMSFLIKLTYSIIFAYPANILVNYIKRITGIDVYDFPVKYSPLKYFSDEVKP